jgi:hypothetical protein
VRLRVGLQLLEVGIYELLAAIGALLRDKHKISPLLSRPSPSPSSSLRGTPSPLLPLTLKRLLQMRSCVMFG